MLNPNSSHEAFGDVDKKSTASDATPKPSTPQDDTLLFGVSLARLSPTQSFVFLAFGALFCALTFAALQEKVFLIEGARCAGNELPLLR